MRKFHLTRRDMIVGALGAVTMPAVLRGSPALAAETTLTVATYGSILNAQKASLFDPYEKANPSVRIATDPSYSDAKLKSMVDVKNVTWDLCNMSGLMGFDTDAQWLEPIDYSVVDKSKFMPGYARTYSVGIDIEAAGMTYRTDRLEGKTSGLSTLFNLDLKGKRALYKFSGSGILEAALLDDGVVPDQLYPLDVPRALKKLDTIKSNTIWWESGADAVQLLTSGEADMGLLWLSSATTAMKSAPLKVDWSSWIPDGGWWGVPKGSKNVKEAMKAINFFTEPAPQIAFTKYMPYAPTNRFATEMDSAFKGNLPLEHLKTKVPMNYAWWSANIQNVEQEFQAWLLT